MESIPVSVEEDYGAREEGGFPLPHRAKRVPDQPPGGSTNT